MSAPGTFRRRSTSGVRALSVALAGAALSVAVLPAMASAAAPLVQFAANYSDCVVYGVGPANTNIKIRWTDSDGSLKHVQTVRSKANHRFQTTCDADEQVERGDVFKATIGSKSRSFTVPVLGYRIDREANTITGKAPASAALTIVLPGTNVKPTLTSEGDGTFAYDASGNTNIIGSGWVTVSYTTAPGDLVTRDLQAPFITASRGRADVFMRGRPGSTVNVQLFDGPTELADVDCKVGPTGDCWLQFTDEDGHLVRARAGLRIVSDIATDADFIIPALSVTGAPATDVISGTCFAGDPSPYYLQAYRPAGAGGVSRSGTTNAQGKFSTDVTSKFDLRSGDKVLAECMFATGDWVERLITVP